MRRLALLSALALAACEDPVGVCDARHACEVEGVDLAIVRAELVNPLGTNPESGLLEAPRELHVGYVVRNRGSRPAGEAWLRAAYSAEHYDRASRDSARIPALEPGDSVTGTLAVRVQVPFVVNDIVKRVTLALVREDRAADAAPENDLLDTPDFQLAIPALGLVVEPPGVPRLFVNEPFVLRYTIQNLSRHERLEGVDLALCLWEYDLPCVPPWDHTLSSRFQLPALAPGQTVTGTRTIAVEATAAWQDLAWNYGMTACALERSWTDPYLTDVMAVSACAGMGVVRMRPDYEGACAPPLLQPGVTLTVAAYNCGLLPPTQQLPRSTNPDYYNERLLQNRFVLAAAELAAGRTYGLSANGGSAGFQLRDAQGEAVTMNDPAAFGVARSGRYYLVMGGKPPLELMLTER